MTDKELYASACDQVLRHLERTNGTSTIAQTLNILQLSGALQKSIESILVSRGFIKTFGNDGYGNISVAITSEGRDFITMSSFTEQLKKEKVQERKDFADLQLAENMAKDYPDTKKHAKASLFISIFAAIIALFTFLWEVFKK